MFEVSSFDKWFSSVLYQMWIIYIDASVNDIVPVYRADNFNKGGKSNHRQVFFSDLGRIATNVIFTEYSGHVW